MEEVLTFIKQMVGRVGADRRLCHVSMTPRGRKGMSLGK